MHSLSEYWLLLSGIILKNFLVCLGLGADQGDVRGCSKTRMQPPSLQGWSCLQGFFQASPSALGMGTPLNFLPKTLLLSSGGSVQENTWWMWYNFHTIHLGGEAVQKKKIFTHMKHYKMTFSRGISCAIAPTLQRSFNVTVFPLISEFETMLFTAYAQHIYALFPRVLFQNWQKPGQGHLKTMGWYDENIILIRDNWHTWM